jgi:hypothetical protein
MTRWRNLQPEDVAAARQMLRERCPHTTEPRDWTKLWGKFVDGTLVAFYGIQHRYIVEPACATSIHHMEDICVSADTALSFTPEYEFYVMNDNVKFQELLNERYGIEGHEERPGKAYIIRRDDDGRIAGEQRIEENAGAASEGRAGAVAAVQCT